jgi:glutamate racemase
MKKYNNIMLNIEVVWFGGKEVKVGFFDSGIGGITVLHEALKVLPNENYIYYADTLNAPYGIKPKDIVKKHIFEAIEFMANQGVCAIVIACNTATSIAIDELRSKYRIPILGMEPAVKPAVENNKDSNKRVLVTATPLTLSEEKLKNLISKVGNEEIIDLAPLPGLVELAEKFEFRNEIVMSYLGKELSKFKLENYGTIVLGCTHFPLFKDSFRSLLPRSTEIIDGAKGTVRNLVRIVGKDTQLNGKKGSITFYNSGNLVKDKILLKKYDELLKRLDEI